MILKMPSDTLKLTEDPLVDESIEQYEYHEYHPITGAHLNNNGEITSTSNRKTY